MSSKYFPVFLDLEGKNVLVIGSGPVARQKIRSLSGTGCRVTVVSAGPKPVGQKNVQYKNRPFRASDLAGRDLVFCATGDEPLNRLVGKLCRRKGILVNVADRPNLCSFIMPSLVRRGGVTFAISTGGRSPALAKFLRKKLEKHFPRAVGGLAQILRGARNRIIQLPLKQRRALLSRILNERSLSQIKRGWGGRVRRNLNLLLKGV